MDDRTPELPRTSTGVFTPLSQPDFRNIWLASLISNTGNLIQGVGSAWVMSDMATADMVAMVQTATFLPMALLALPAGAIADMYDRRKSQMAALTLALLGAVAMTIVSMAGLMTPWALLGFCFLVGSGVALFGPSWQSSPGEQVPPHMLPQAVALNGISYNIARSFGPALGGLIIALAGATATFAANALCYLPIVLALYLWKRTVVPSRLPPERLHRAMLSGIRYIMNMRSVRTAVGRSFLNGILGASLLSLMPLIARDVLASGAQGFGLLLGCFGGGAVAAIFALHQVRRLSNERAAQGCGLVLSLCVGTLAISRNLALSAVTLIIAGAAWMILVTTFSIALQMLVPRWVAGRAIAALNATTAGGIAVGSIIWGTMAQHYGVATALLIAAGLWLILPLLGFVIPIADRETPAEALNMSLADPDVKLGINGRSGPIVVDLTYRIPAENARDFYNLMTRIQRIRSRNGAYDWSVSRDIADPEKWLERFRCPTWHDYLRQRARCTAEEMAVQQQAEDLHFGSEPILISRRLERPLGSVRWQAGSPDRGNIDLAMPGA